MSLLKLSLAALPALALARRPHDNCTTTTTCPEITLPTILPPIKVGPKDKGDHWENVYEVVYETFCPTGLKPHTYTVTKTCDSAYCGGRPTDGPEDGFTTTKTVCSSCGPEVITATLTVPTGGAGGEEDVTVIEATSTTTEFVTVDFPEPSCYGEDCEVDDDGPVGCEGPGCDDGEEDGDVVAECTGPGCDDEGEDGNDDATACVGPDCSEEEPESGVDDPSGGNGGVEGESPVVAGGLKLEVGVMAIAMPALMALPLAI